MLNSTIYIVGIGSISAQGFDEGSLLNDLQPLQQTLFLLKEPNYSEYIEGNNIRRMGKLMKAFNPLFILMQTKMVLVIPLFLLKHVQYLMDMLATMQIAMIIIQPFIREPPKYVMAWMMTVME